VVVFPTPPFWLHNEITRAGPWDLSAGGSAKSRIGRPVGPVFTADFAISKVYSEALTGAWMGALVHLTEGVNRDFRVNLSR
jgi:hypothetical protein